MKHLKIYFLGLLLLVTSVSAQVTNKDLTQLEAVGLLNTLFVINSKGQTQALNDHTQLLQVLRKEKLLKSNIFELLDLRTKLDKSAFHYLIDDYFRELSTWIKTASSVEKEAKNHVKNYQPEIQDYLMLQHQALLDHHIELKRHFGDWKSWFEIERVFKHSLYDFDKNEYKKNDTVAKAPLKIRDETNVPILKDEKSKSPIISEIEVDRFLLETIFNVDFSKIDS